MRTTKRLWCRTLPIAIAVIAFAIWRYRWPADIAADVRAPERTVTSRSLMRDTPVVDTAEPGPMERSVDVPALRKALTGRPDAEAELHRIVGFARFRDRVAAYGNGKDRLSAAERTREARQILAELPDHVVRNEIVPIQAQAIAAALLEDIDPDPLTRGATLAALRRQWNAYARRSVGPSPVLDPRYRAYASQSRAIFQEVQASIPDPSQQQAVIAKRLQALRERLFDHASSSTDAY